VTYLELWARAFGVTLAVELAVATWFLPKEASYVRRLGAVAVANVASHPAVWFVFPDLISSWQGALLSSELWALGLEILVYRLVFPSLPWQKALAASALANGASIIAGLVLRALGVAL
jgi:hypothetical protein